MKFDKFSDLLIWVKKSVDNLRDGVIPEINGIFDKVKEDLEIMHDESHSALSEAKKAILEAENAVNTANNIAHTPANKVSYGVVKLADDVDIEEGNSKVVTALSLKRVVSRLDAIETVPVATEGVYGKSRKATQSEAKLMVENSAHMTPQLTKLAVESYPVATTIKSGLMSAEDKKTLDSIQTSSVHEVITSGNFEAIVDDIDLYYGNFHVTSEVQNMPYSGDWTILVKSRRAVDSRTDFALVECIDKVDTDKRYERSCNAGVWGSWYKFVSSGEEGEENSSDRELTTYKNKLVNGNFDIWRTASSNVSRGVKCVADRWIINNSSAIPIPVTVSRQSFDIDQTDVPGYPRYFHRLKYTPEYAPYSIKQRIFEYEQLNGRNVTLSFWAKGSQSVKISTSLESYITSTNIVRTDPQEFEVTTAWKQYVYTSKYSKLASGAEFFGISIDILVDSSQGSYVDLDISKVQLEIGTVPTSYEERDIRLEREQCGKFFQTVEGDMLYMNISVLNSTQAICWLPYDNTYILPKAAIEGVFALHYLDDSKVALSASEVKVFKVNKGSLNILLSPKAGINTTKGAVLYATTMKVTLDSELYLTSESVV